MFHESFLFCTHTPGSIEWLSPAPRLHTSRGTTAAMRFLQGALVIVILRQISVPLFLTTLKLTHEKNSRVRLGVLGHFHPQDCFSVIFQTFWQITQRVPPNLSFFFFRFGFLLIRAGSLFSLSMDIDRNEVRRVPFYPSPIFDDVVFDHWSTGGNTRFLRSSLSGEGIVRATISPNKLKASIRDGGRGLVRPTDSGPERHPPNPIIEIHREMMEHWPVEDFALDPDKFMRNLRSAGKVHQGA